MSRDYTTILSDMLARLPADLDKREGSLIWDALAPAAVEMENLYTAEADLMNEAFADTCGRSSLIRRCSERGITPVAASYAVLRGEFNQDIDIGTRFSLRELNYAATSQISTGTYRMTCETAGTAANAVFGDLVPVTYIEGLKSAKLTALLIPGEAEEDTEVLRARFMASFDAQAFSGNIKDYEDKVNALQGVGGVKVYPVWNGGGTVKLVIIDSDYNVPSSSLVSSVQTAVCPASGEGKGLAPIGHNVTVAAVSGVTINTGFTLTFATGIVYADVQTAVEAAVASVLLDYRRNWQDGDGIIVRISAIEVAVLQVTGVVDVSGTTINDTAANLTLTETQIPIAGTVTNHAAS